MGWGWLLWAVSAVGRAFRVCLRWAPPPFCLCLQSAPCCVCYYFVFAFVSLPLRGRFRWTRGDQLAVSWQPSLSFPVGLALFLLLSLSLLSCSLCFHSLCPCGAACCFCSLLLLAPLVGFFLCLCFVFALTSLRVSKCESSEQAKLVCGD